ncbi:helicase-related protein [Desulfoplanes sp.]
MSTTDEQESPLIESYRALSGVPQLLLHILAVNVAACFNLTAADYVIHMAPWWNPAVEDQASDRAHRIGQQRPVTVYRLVVGDSIEEQIVALHKEKRDLATSILAGTDASGKVSADKLLGLLRGGSDG